MSLLHLSTDDLVVIHRFKVEIFRHFLGLSRLFTVSITAGNYGRGEGVRPLQGGSEGGMMTLV